MAIRELPAALDRTEMFMEGKWAVSLERDRERARDLQEICDIQEKAQGEMGLLLCVLTLK